MIIVIIILIILIIVQGLLVALSKKADDEACAPAPVPEIPSSMPDLSALMIGIDGQPATRPSPEASDHQFIKSSLSPPRFQRRPQAPPPLPTGLNNKPKPKAPPRRPPQR